VRVVRVLTSKGAAGRRAADDAFETVSIFLVMGVMVMPARLPATLDSDLAREPHAFGRGEFVAKHCEHCPRR
jgi:hypothetical protein